MNKKNDFNKKTGELNVILTMSYSEFLELKSFLGTQLFQSALAEQYRQVWPTLDDMYAELKKD